MKKIVLMAAAFALATAAFAKPARVTGWKDVAKIADKNGMEVVEDKTEWFIAKSNGGKDFAVYAVCDFKDMNVTLAMSCIKGEIFSKIYCQDKANGEPYLIYSLVYGDQKCVLVNGKDFGIYAPDEEIAFWTEKCKGERASFLADLAKDYGLVIPR
ncbi:MAG: hypothetical protein IK015_09405 [Treponema sp.]|nr:hypothetical protein [Treponema sp.]